MKLHDRLAWLIKHVPLIQWLYRHGLSLAFRAMGLFCPVDEKLALFSSYGGDQYSDSPKVLCEAMSKDPRFAGFRFVWAFSNPDAFEVPGAQKVKIDTLSYFKTALRAGVWITNVNIERGLRFKRPEQVYLNTWHGTGPKKGGNAVRGRKDYDFSYVDIVCVDGAYARDEMISCFNAREDHLLYSGRPREDALLTFTENDARRVRGALGIPEGKKVLLYMPTWREYEGLRLDPDAWTQALSDKYVMLVRAHHFDGSALAPRQQAFFIDATDWPDVNELYWVSDILISDYSSAFFDFGLLGRPMVCFAYDYERYEASSGLLMDLKNEFPGGIRRTERDAIDAIATMDFDALARQCKAYVDGYVRHPGNATQMCLDALAEALARRAGRSG